MTAAEAAETAPTLAASSGQKSTWGCGALSVAGIVIVSLIIGVFSLPSTSRSSTSGSGYSSPASTEYAPAAGTPRVSSTYTPQWLYSSVPDEMSNGLSYTASIESSNTVSFDFPYNGEQRATLTLRSHPRWGKNIILQIERGQLLCSSYDGCTVLVRFDDTSAQSFSASTAADNSTETLFITNYKRFLAGLRTAKRVRIAVAVHQEGNPSFDFDVSGFNMVRFIPSK